MSWDWEVCKLFFAMAFTMFYCHTLTDSTASGLTEDELSASLATLNSLAVSCNADMSVLRKKPADKGFIVECLVRQRAAEDDFMEVR